MRPTRHRYKNALGAPVLSFAILLGLVFLSFGCGYAYLKNQVHHKEVRKLEIQQEIHDLHAEADQLENRILAATTAEALRPLIEQRQTGLEPVPASAVVTIVPAAPGAPLAADPPAVARN